MKDAWKETSTALRGKVRVAEIDLKGHRIDVPHLTGFPTIRWIVNGNIEDQYHRETTMEAFSKFAFEKLKKQKEI